MSLEANSTKIAELKTKINALPAAGLDTSDATAAAADIISGKTAYAGGEKVTGSLEKAKQVTGDVTSKAILNGRAMFSGKTSKAFAVDSNKGIALTMAAADLGDAAAADVAKGKTFTSENGFKLTGTHEEAAAPSGSIRIMANGTYDVTSKASAVVNVPTSGGSAYVKEAGIVSFDSISATASDGTEYVKFSATIEGAEENEAISAWSSYPNLYRFVIPFYTHSSESSTSRLTTLELWRYYNDDFAQDECYGEIIFPGNNTAWVVDLVSGSGHNFDPIESAQQWFNWVYFGFDAQGQFKITFAVDSSVPDYLILDPLANAPMLMINGIITI